MTDELPKGWVKTTLGEVCLPVDTIWPADSPDTEFTYFDIGGIDNNRYRIAETKTISGRNAPSRARQAVHKGDILFSTVRTYLRKIARIEQDYPNPVASTGFAVIRAAEGVSSQFLFFQVLSDNFLQPLHMLQTGSSYPAVRERDVFAQPILLPPMAEQERIVAKLNAALSAIHRAKVASLRARERLQRYHVAVLKAAVTGELTREWRESERKKEKANTETGKTLLERFLVARRNRWEEAELARLRIKSNDSKSDRWKSRYPSPVDPDITNLPELPQEWAWASLDMIAEIVSGISVSQNRLVKNPVELPYLRVANVLRGYLDLTEVKTIRVEEERVDEYLLKAGDILFNEGGDRDKLGRGWVWEGQIPNCVHQNHVFRARLIDLTLLDPRLVSHWGNTFGQDYFLTHGKQTTNLASINRAVLSKLPVPIPPAAEQTEIVRELDQRLLAANRLAATLEQQLTRVNAASQSLLYQAFAGRLVPQDPEEESASILLKRIRASCEAKVVKTKVKRMPKPKSTITRRPLLDVLRENKEPMRPEQLFTKAGFTPMEVDIFYRELALLRDKLLVNQPRDSDAMDWPNHVHVILQLKEDEG